MIQMQILYPFSNSIDALKQKLDLLRSDLECSNESQKKKFVPSFSSIIDDFVTSKERVNMVKQYKVLDSTILRTEHDYGLFVP